MLRRKGRLQRPGASTNPWPERPAQRMLVVIAGIESVALLYAIVKVGLDVVAWGLLNLIWFGSMFVLSVLYRQASKRRFP